MLSSEEIDKLKKSLSTFFSSPFNHDLSGESFEAIFTFCKNVSHEHAGKKSKAFFDVVKRGNGWSLKTLTDKSNRFFKGRAVKFDLVLMRADVEGKHKISLTGDPQVIGNSIIEIYNNLLSSFMEKQQVRNPLLGFLLRSYDNKEFIYFEKDMRPYKENEIKWGWTNETRRSLTGSIDGEITFIWYKTGRQLFGRYIVPENAIQFSISWKNES